MLGGFILQRSWLLTCYIKYSLVVIQIFLKDQCVVCMCVIVGDLFCSLFIVQPLVDTFEDLSALALHLVC
jgi:hypothetical protein